MAFTYGINYLVLTTIPGIFLGVYKENVGIAGLNYIALGIGFTGTSQIAARQVDQIYAALKAKNGGEGKPEYRLGACRFFVEWSSRGLTGRIVQFIFSSDHYCYQLAC